MKSRYIPKQLKDKVKARFDGKCGYCGCKSDKLQVDHIEPHASFTGSNEESNLMPACAQCNNFKFTHSLEQFRIQLSYQVGSARRYSVNFRFAEKFDQIAITEKPIVFYFEKEQK